MDEPNDPLDSEPSIETIDARLRILSDRENAHYTEIMLTLQKLSDASEMNAAEEVEDLFDEAVVLVREAGKASTSYLQRSLDIGYATAAKLVDELEARRIVGPANGARPREVLPFNSETVAKQISERSEMVDELYDDAVECVREVGYASAKLLQTELDIGYARAASLMDRLEEGGVIAPGHELRRRVVDAGEDA